ncbi:uncharacterized protein NPIL_492391 [Nephila pilipes]|uniref:BESS domain-containing protein n=1 Tax=Nephila pilipes TaxID=299642 RepID=A0A8X6ULM5_NEPPI|nr:uncharacterized protein NPIL_492391 [Nephila pilipes]
MTGTEDFTKQFYLLLDRYTSKSVAYLRSIISSEVEAEKFVNLFSERTYTKWIPHVGQSDTEKFVFHKTWVCHRSWRKKGKSTFRDDCNAKIDIFIKTPDPTYIRHDEYLKYDPPLPCVIEISGKHTHDVGNYDDSLAGGMADEVKEQFFKYFDSGLSVVHARRKYDFLLKLKSTNIKTSKLRYNPTVRQTQHLYNHWQKVKHCGGTTLRETNGKFRPVTFDEFLNALPKKEFLQSHKNSPSVLRTPSSISTVQSNQFPLVFVSTGFSGTLSSSAAPLLFKLKFGTHGDFVSDLTAPRLYSVRIDSSSILKDKLPTSVNSVPFSELSSSSPKEISIKEEPLDSDEESTEKTSNPGNVKDSSIMPVIIKAYSCEDSSTPTQKASVAGSFSFPLIFMLTGSINDSSVNTRSLVYVLKQGSGGIYLTQDVMPQIFSVQINSSNQATFKVKNDSAYKTEGPLNVHVKVERSLKNSSVASPNIQLKEEASTMPVILNVSSYNYFPPDTDGSETCDKLENDSLLSTDTNNCAISSKSHSGNNYQSASEINYCNTNDEDYRFLMSLLPALKRLPPNEKTVAKKKIQDIVLASRLISSKVQFEKRSSNIYRDCGVLPISGGWKF